MDSATLYEKLRSDKIEVLLAQFVDLLGVAKAKAIPMDGVPEFLTSGCGFAGAALVGMRQAPNDPDMIALPDLDSYTPLPWRSGVGRVACNLTVDGRELPLCTRTVLRHHIERARERGLSFQVGVEPEFFLLRRNGKGLPSPYDESDHLAKPCYDFNAISGSLPILTKISSVLNTLGWGVYQFDHEDGNGQFEVNFRYADALTTADRFILFKMLAGDIARESGAIASFMAKPLQGRTGSGMHAHFSLWNADVTRNLFEGNDGHPVSKLALQFAAGVLAHSRAFTAIAAPTVNCYKRLMISGSASGYTWVPAYASLGNNNRTHMLRIPAPGRIECRVISSANNPYLSLAALLVAGLDGIERDLDLPTARSDNMYVLDAAARQKETLLPQSLPEALDALEEDPLFAEKLGEAVIDEFLDIKRREWSEYHSSVSPWETDRYLESL